MGRNGSCGVDLAGVDILKAHPDVGVKLLIEAVRYLQRYKVCLVCFHTLKMSKDLTVRDKTWEILTISDNDLLRLSLTVSTFIPSVTVVSQ